MKLNRYFLGALLCAFTVCLSDTVEMSQSLLTSLRAKRDGALKKIAAQKLSANEIGHELLCLLEYAFKRGIQERRVQMGKDPHHFSHFTNVAAIVTAKVAQVMKGNYLYHSLRLGQSEYEALETFVTLDPHNPGPFASFLKK